MGPHKPLCAEEGVTSKAHLLFCLDLWRDVEPFMCPFETQVDSETCHDGRPR